MSVDPERVARAAAALVAVRRGAPRPRALPADAAPASAAEAYAVQREVARRLNAGVGAWKVAMSDVHTGTAAPVFGTDLLTSPAHFSAAYADRYGIEPEIAFSLGRDLPARAGGYAREAVIEAIDSAYAAIEVVVSRFEPLSGAPPLDRLADNISNGGLIVGAPLRDWRRLDICDLPLELTLSGHSVHRGHGGHPQLDPLIPLLWLANHLAQSDGLRAGQLVTTGSCAGLRWVEAGVTAQCRFEGLGDASVRLG